MVYRHVFLFLFTALLAAACSPVHISSDYNDEVDFKGFETYSWYEPNEYNKKSDDYLNNDILDSQIRQDVDQQLGKKGMRKVAQADADFLVNYTVTAEDRMDVDTYNTYSGFAPGWGYAGFYGAYPYRYYGTGFSYGVTGTETKVTHYRQGTFVLDIVEPNSDKLVWRGTAEGRIPKNLSADEKRDAVENVVAGVLENFPPK